MPLSPYAVTKLACEHLARASERSLGLDVVVLRYFADLSYAEIAEVGGEGLLSHDHGGVVPELVAGTSVTGKCSSDGSCTFQGSVEACSNE